MRSLAENEAETQSAPSRANARVPRMATEVPLRCRCGRVRGVVTDVAPETVNRLVCYCDDCQAFAAFLGQPGVTNGAGGTDVCHVAQSRVKILEGEDELRCMRLSEKGMIRWFAGCCRTPIGNTINGRLPAIGLVHSFMDHETDGRSRDSVLGKPVASVYGRFAIGEPPPGVHRIAPLSLVVRTIRLVATWWITKKGTPSPFFHPGTLAPKVAPQVLRPDEREALRRGASAAAHRQASAN